MTRLKCIIFDSLRETLYNKRSNLLLRILLFLFVYIIMGCIDVNNDTNLNTFNLFSLSNLLFLIISLLIFFLFPTLTLLRKTVSFYVCNIFLVFPYFFKFLLFIHSLFFVADDFCVVVVLIEKEYVLLFVEFHVFSFFVSLNLISFYIHYRHLTVIKIRK